MPYAWERFRDGNYVAIGWLRDNDLTGMRIDEISDLIRRQNDLDERSIGKAIEAFTRFLDLNIGDFVAVKNVGFGLFGIGVITSNYQYSNRMHDTGGGDQGNFYSHFRRVNWLYTDYVSLAGLGRLEGEPYWQPFGAVGAIFPEIPPYIIRFLRQHRLVEAGDQVIGVDGNPRIEQLARLPLAPEPAIQTVPLPNYLHRIVQSINDLRGDANHLEAAHVPIVVSLFAALGYRETVDIVIGQERVDVSIRKNQRTILIIEVKRNWDLNRDEGVGAEAIKQAYGYAHRLGVRFVLVTNGDTYIIYDRLKGLSWDSNFWGEFRLTALQEDGLKILERLRPEQLNNPSIAETFKNLSECFEPQA